MNNYMDCMTVEFSFLVKVVLVTDENSFIAFHIKLTPARGGFVADGFVLFWFFFQLAK